MKTLLVISTFALFTSCSNAPYRPESFEAKMSRYNPADTTYGSVISMEIPLVPMGTRTPASAPEPTVSVYKEMSNKKLYFETLYKEYYHFASYSEVPAKDLAICPNFHNSLLTLKNTPSLEKRSWFLKENKELLQNKTNYPELYLSLSYDSAYPRIVDQLNSPSASSKDLFSKALGIHIQKTYGELIELCETGTSDNYYVFENLVTLASQKGGFAHKQEYVDAVFKSNIMANARIITSLKQNSKVLTRAPASTGEKALPELEEVVARLQTHWVKDYLKLK